LNKAVNKRGKANAVHTLSKRIIYHFARVIGLDIHLLQT